MSKRPLAAIILAAGEGTRMKSARPKVLHGIAGRPMLGHVLAAAAALNPERTVAVLGRHAGEVGAYLEREFPGVVIAVQEEQKGTGHAVLCAKGALEGFAGDVLILCGDVPLVTEETLRALLKRHRGGAVSVAGFEAGEPGGYGRVIRDASGNVEKIVEARDARPGEKTVTFCNSGVMAADSRHLFALLAKVGNDNAKDEYYLTDIVALANAAGLTVRCAEGAEEEFQGVNSRSELAAAEAAMQQKLRNKMMDGGATLTAPETVHLAADTKLGKDVTVGPFVVFGAGVTVEDGATIHAFCHVEGARIRKGASVGPFTRLRPGADIGEGARVGSYVEVKKSTLGRGAKANHLAYIGDAEVGAGANVGAGVITCNYDGASKHVTEIGEGAFIGSNASLVAPVKIGKRAVIGAGSVITEDVPDDAMALERTGQKTVAGGATAYRKSRTRKA